MLVSLLKNLVNSDKKILPYRPVHTDYQGIHKFWINHINCHLLKFQVDQIGSKVDRHLAMRRDKDKMNSKMKNDNQEQQYVGSTKKINFGMLRLLETLTLISTRQNQKMEKIKASINNILRPNSSNSHNPQHPRVKITDVSK